MKYCPVCDRAVLYVSKRPTCDSRCEWNHTWFRCPQHNLCFVGKPRETAGSFECVCVPWNAAGPNFQSEESNP